MSSTPRKCAVCRDEGRYRELGTHEVCVCSCAVGQALKGGQQQRVALLTAEAFELEAQALSSKAEALVVRSEAAEANGLPRCDSARRNAQVMRESADIRRQAARTWRTIAGVHVGQITAGGAA